MRNRRTFCFAIKSRRKIYETASTLLTFARVATAAVARAAPSRVTTTKTDLPGWMTRRESSIVSAAIESALQKTMTRLDRATRGILFPSKSTLSFAEKFASIICTPKIWFFARICGKERLFHWSKMMVQAQRGN